MENGAVIEWRIENWSHWCREAHGHSISSPEIPYPCNYMQLYPKGISGQEEHLVVRLCGVNTSCDWELSFRSSYGDLLCYKQKYKQRCEKNYLQFMFEYVHHKCYPYLINYPTSVHPESGDFITVKILVKDRSYNEYHVCTTLNVLKISLEINPIWVETMESNATTKDILYVEMPYYDPERIWLKIFSDKNNMVHFTIVPPTFYEDPYSVEMFLGLIGKFDCVKEHHVFCAENPDPWTFPKSLKKEEIVGKGISLFFCLNTKDPIDSSFYMSCAYSCISIKSKDKICFPERVMDPVTSNKVEALTKDSGSQTLDMPDDPVLIEQLMCLYQDQDFSDITLKCDNVTFPVHKNILSARSPVFKAMLSTDMKETASSEVDIRDLDPSTLSHFLTFLYTGAVELECERALKLYYAADKYQVPSLKRDCSKFLLSNVSVSNVCDILSLADRHRDDVLTSVAHDFILKNYNEVLKSKEWESFMCREALLAVKTVTHFAAKDRVRMHDP